MFLLSELAEHESRFLVKLLITTTLVNDHLGKPMLFPLPVYPCLSPVLRVSGKPFIVKLTSESFKIWYIFEFQWFTSLLPCALVPHFFNRDLFESPY